MHMADALITPLVGGTLWAATTGIGAVSVNKVKTVLDEKKVPLMGVMGAFVFAAQMINFAIPGTGSSGHIGGGLLLAILLGPYAGFLTMASILTIQALFFADGGLLALGCNIFNLGFFTCFIAYPLIYKPILKRGYSTAKIFLASFLASVIGLQLGSFSVVLETLISGKIDLPFNTFVTLMQVIHLAIGIVEGLVVTTIVSFVYKSRPDILEASANGTSIGNRSILKVIALFLVAAILVGGILSRFASTQPDGLEWSLMNAVKQELPMEHPVFKPSDTQVDQGSSGETKPAITTQAVSTEANSSVGFIGGSILLILVGCAGFFVSVSRKKRNLKNARHDECPK